MSTIEKAIEIAAKAHAGVIDKQGVPYILHPIRVMMGVEGNNAQIVAVLHDVVEDTEFSLDDLMREGFCQEVIEALSLVTHCNTQSYSDYIISAKNNRIARQVKLSDLRDNTSLSRILLRSDKMEGDSSRIQRYLLSYQFLTDEISEDDYRQLMASIE